jgi:hypothetical protein
MAADRSCESLVDQSVVQNTIHRERLIASIVQRCSDPKAIGGIYVVGLALKRRIQIDFIRAECQQSKIIAPGAEALSTYNQISTFLVLNISRTGEPWIKEATS